jgi:UDP-N-acetylglucosamine 2-epimerase
MSKVLIASFSRSSEGALSKLKKEMGEILTTSLEESDYILAVGDRKETFDFVLRQWEAGKKIIHLWAGEGITDTNDDVYRNSMTLMSVMQLCTNNEAKAVVDAICGAVGGKSNAFVVGNVMLDNLEIDESLVPTWDYELSLINPGNPVIHAIGFECDKILETLPRPQFLGLLKNCKKFITNSSCEYYEAPLFLKPEQIEHAGWRNKQRGSKYGDMNIKNATENIIKTLKTL